FNKVLAAFALLLPLAVPGLATADITATSAADVCSPTANPCLVTTTVNVVPSSTLDFGGRAVVVKTGGKLDFGSGPAWLLCGDLTVQPSSSYARIVARANDGSGVGTVGGAVVVFARGSCSGNPAVAC